MIKKIIVCAPICLLFILSISTNGPIPPLTHLSLDAYINAVIEGKSDQQQLADNITQGVIPRKIIFDSLHKLLFEVSSLNLENRIAYAKELLNILSTIKQEVSSRPTKFEKHQQRELEEIDTFMHLLQFYLHMTHDNFHYLSQTPQALTQGGNSLLTKHPTVLWSAVEYAFNEDQPIIVQWFIDYGANPNSGTNEQHPNLLHYAATQPFANADIVKILINAGAQFPSTNAFPVYKSIFFNPVDLGNEKVLQLLVKKFPEEINRVYSQNEGENEIIIGTLFDLIKNYYVTEFTLQNLNTIEQRLQKFGFKSYEQIRQEAIAKRKKEVEQMYN